MMIAVFVLALACIGVIIALALRFETSRQATLRQDMGKWARDRRLEFRDNGDSGFWRTPIGVEVEEELVKPFRPSHSRQLGTSRLCGSGNYGGRETCTFEYSYITSTGKSQHAVRTTIAAAKIARSSPPFFIRRQGLGDKIKAIFGAEDIHCGDADFDKDFFLGGDNAAFVKTLVTHDVKALIRKNPRWLYRGIDGYVLVASVTEINPTIAQQLLDCAVELAKQVERSGRP